MSKKNIRNFCIIAHIDHGKSTLADRFLELTSSVDQKKMRPQYLDQMDLERGRGITIKLHPCRMIYRAEIPNPNLKIQNSKSQINSLESSASDLWLAGPESILNLIDTPGHVDFSYEVSRSLAAVEGAILLVDAASGVQAQTLANLETAQKQGIIIVPVINKIDLPQAQIEKTELEIKKILDLKEELEITKISAKSGINVKNLLEEIIHKIPPPGQRHDLPLRALIFDSKYDPFLGIVAYVRIIEGELKVNDDLVLIRKNVSAKAKEAGWFLPQFSPQKKLSAGEMGYVALGLKNPEAVRIGDTITSGSIRNSNFKIEPLEGYQEPKPVVFTSVFTRDSNDWAILKDSLMRLKLNDASLFFEPESKSFLGKGFRCGFLGLLHAEIITERLTREFGLDLVVSSPSVIYKIIDRNGKEVMIYNPEQWPQESEIGEIYERFAEVKIVSPQNFLSPVLKLLKELQPSVEMLSQSRYILKVKMPLREVIIGFYDRLKSVSQGYASMDYKILDWQKSELVKLEFLIGGRVQEPISKIVPKKDSFNEGKKIAELLKDVLPAQLFELPVQVRAHGRILVRKTIKAKRRDVIAPLYGGDYTRKKKLLERQKRGKKELKEKGQFSISPEVFWKIIKID